MHTTTASLARRRLADPTSRLLVLTGAGLSAASGLPTYRGSGGLYPSGALIPLQARDATSSKVAGLWDRLRPLQLGARRVAPNAGHVALARFEAAGRHVTVVTQNVDGLHTRAGSRQVVELHGSLDRARCLNPKCQHTGPAPTAPDSDHEDGVVRCSACRARLRPDVVLFGERLDRDRWNIAARAAFECDVVLAVGTSLQVHPAASLVETALATGAAGAWLDTDPAAALAELDEPDRTSFSALELVPGDCSYTLPCLLDTPGF